MLRARPGACCAMLRRAGALAASAAGAAASGVPPNRLPGLVPPSGGWRGSTGGSTGSPAVWEQTYGHQLHMYRSFKTPKKIAVTAPEAAFVAAGGILWYNTQPKNWSNAGSGAFDATIDQYAAAVKGLAPAQVIVTAGHEPNGHCDPTSTKDYYGSPAEYRAMWARYRARFSAAGVDNAVWVMDYSRQLRKPDDFQKWVQPLWPGDGVVDWLFFNCFGDHPMADKQGRGNWTAIVGSIYSQLESGAGAGHNYTAVPWGLGAWDTKVEGPDGPIPEADRIEFITQAAAAVNSSQFPRLRGLVHYDNTIVSAGLRPAYDAYMSSSFFTANDAA